MIYVLGDPTDFCYAYDYFISIITSSRNKIHFVISQDREKVIKWFERQQSQYNNHRYLFLGDDYDIIVEDPKNIFILNTKKLSDPVQKNKIETYATKYKIVDYSLGNSQIVPSIYLPYQVNVLDIRNMPKSSHVCFVGNSSPNRDEVLKLSEQPAALYQTKYGGLPSQACPLLDIHNNILSINANATVII